MTSREIELGRNELEQTFRKLKPESQAAIAKARKEGCCEGMDVDGKWCVVPKDCFVAPTPWRVYRIPPQTVPELEQQQAPATPDGCDDMPVAKFSDYWAYDGTTALTIAPSHTRFVGIVWREPSGRTFVSPRGIGHHNANGCTPIAVRVRKAVTR